MKTVLTLLVSACLSVQGFAETVGEQWIRTSFENLRNANTVGIRLVGTETLDQKTTEFVTDVWFVNELGIDGRTTAKLDIREYRNSVLSRRMVGDGDVFWVHNLNLNEYSASVYGSQGTTRPDDHLRKLLLSFQARGQGQSLWLARLLLDVWGQSAARFVTWIPEASESVAGGYVSYTAPAPLSRQVSFGIEGDLSTAQLTNIAFQESGKVGTKPRAMAWTATITTAPVIQSDVFVFAPPLTARPIASPVRQN